MNKVEVRKTYLAQRMSLSEANHQQLSIDLYQLFFKFIDLSQVSMLHLYMPLEKFREPNTRLIAQQIRQQFPTITLVAPVVNPANKEIESHVLNELELKESAWGIPEPKTSRPIHPKDIDVVIVPLVAFDERGFRVGYGKGFYDKFLVQCRKDCNKVGLSFFPPIQTIDDISSFDQKLDIAITPQRVYEFTP